MKIQASILLGLAYRGNFVSDIDSVLAASGALERAGRGIDGDCALADMPRVVPVLGVAVPNVIVGRELPALLVDHGGYPWSE
jgi:hypothetical protein